MVRADTSTSHWQYFYAKDADFVAIDTTALPLDNRGLSYADGFFTTMGVTDGSVLWLDYHKQRLQSHAKALQLDINIQALSLAIQTQARALGQGILKLVITRKAQALRGYGFAPTDLGRTCDIWLQSTPAFITEAAPLTLPTQQRLLLQPSTIAVCLTSMLACLPPPLAGLKSLNRLDSVLASGELQRYKAQDANGTASIGEGLVRDMSGSWVEGTMSNVFYQLAPLHNDDHTQSHHATTPTADYSTHYLTKGQWFTPPMTESGVAGVMRQVIIDSLSQTDNPVILRALEDKDLPKISQMFFCNAVRGVMPITALRLLSGAVVEMD